MSRTTHTVFGVTVAALAGAGRLRRRRGSPAGRRTAGRDGGSFGLPLQLRRFGLWRPLRAPAPVALLSTTAPLATTWASSSLRLRDS